MLAGLILAGLMAGCPKDNPNPTILETRHQPYVADVPVPAKFTLVESKSSNTYTAGRRTVKHLYEGYSEPITVRTFYMNYMPMSNWVITEDTLQDNVYHLKYRKAEERCEIRIEKSATGFRHATQIWATIRSDAPEKF